MFNTLTQRVKADEQELMRLLELSLRIAGVLVAATLVFMTLYFFVASLDIPVIHSRAGVDRTTAIAVDETVASPRRESRNLWEIAVHGTDPFEIIEAASLIERAEGSRNTTRRSPCLPPLLRQVRIHSTISAS
jgi:hypothetical protein